MENQATTAGAAFGRGMAAIITTTFGFIWLGWGAGVLGGLPAAIWAGYFCVAVDGIRRNSGAARPKNDQRAGRDAE